MRKSEYTEEQIIGFLRQVEAGMAVKELGRKHGFSDASFYKLLRNHDYATFENNALWCVLRRLKQSHFMSRNAIEGILDQLTNLVPIEATIATSQSWNCNRLDLQLLHLGNQVHESRLNELNARAIAPMIFCGKVNDVARTGNLAIVVHEHTSDPNLTCLAGGLISLEVVGKFVLELKCNALAHYAYTIHRVDDGINVILPQQVTVSDVTGHDCRTRSEILDRISVLSRHCASLVMAHKAAVAVLEVKNQTRSCAITDNPQHAGGLPGIHDEAVLRLNQSAGDKFCGRGIHEFRVADI